MIHSLHKTSSDPSQPKVLSPFPDLPWPLHAASLSSLATSPCYLLLAWLFSRWPLASCSMSRLPRCLITWETFLSVSTSQSSGYGLRGCSKATSSRKSSQAGNSKLSFQVLLISTLQCLSIDIRQGQNFDFSFPFLPSVLVCPWVPGREQRTKRGQGEAA